METLPSEDSKYLAARAHVAALKGFYIHLTVFVAVMAGLIALDYAGGGDWWVQWPLIGWGLGLLGHAYLVYTPSRSLWSTWEQRKIKETMAKM